MHRNSVLGKPAGGYVVCADGDISEDWAVLLALADDLQVLVAVDDGPLRLAQIVEVASEDDVEVIDESIRRRRQLHGGNVGSGLSKEDRVAGEGLLLHEEDPRVMAELGRQQSFG